MVLEIVLSNTDAWRFCLQLNVIRLISDEDYGPASRPGIQKTADEMLGRRAELGRIWSGRVKHRPQNDVKVTSISQREEAKPVQATARITDDTEADEGLPTPIPTGDSRTKAAAKSRCFGPTEGGPTSLRVDQSKDNNSRTMECSGW